MPSLLNTDRECITKVCKIHKNIRGGVQRVRSLIQLTTDEPDTLSLFNIVPFNRNALGPAILQSPYAIVEEFLILVLQLATRRCR